VSISLPTLSSIEITEPQDLISPNPTEHGELDPGDTEFLIDFSDAPPDNLRTIFLFTTNHQTEVIDTDTCPTSPSSILDEWEDDDIPVTPLTPWQSEPQSAISPSTSFTPFTQNTQAPVEFSSGSAALTLPSLGLDAPSLPGGTEVDQLRGENRQLRGIIASLIDGRSRLPRLSLLHILTEF